MAKQAGKKAEERIVVHKHDRVGSNGAEEDADCFVDAGDVELLVDDDEGSTMAARAIHPPTEGRAALGAASEAFYSGMQR